MTVISLPAVNIPRGPKKSYVLSFLLHVQGWFYRNVSKNHFILMYPSLSVHVFYKVVNTAK